MEVRKFKRLLALGTVLLFCVCMCGCKKEKSKKKQEETSKGYEIVFDGNRYDLSCGMDKLIAQFSENDVLVVDGQKMIPYGPKGLYSDSAEESKEIPNLSLDETPFFIVLSEKYMEKPNKSDFRRPVDSWCCFSFACNATCEFSLAENVTNERYSISDYFDMDETEYEECREKITQGTEETDCIEAYEMLNKKCIAKGFSYFQDFQGPSLVAVVFDDTIVDLEQYRIDDGSTFLEHLNDYPAIQFSDIQMSMSYYLLDNGATVRDLQDKGLASFYSDMTIAQKKGIDNELTAINAVNCGVEMIEKGKLESVYVIRVNEGSVTVDMYQKNGKALVLDLETDPDYDYLWY